MKRLICIFLMTVLLISLFPSAMAFGQAKTEAEIAFNTSNEAYNNINAAYTITEDFSTKIYNAWKCGIEHQKELSSLGLSHFAKDTGLPLEDVKLGMAFFMNPDWEDFTESRKELEADLSDSYFNLGCSVFKDDLFGFCVHLVRATYEVTGKIGEIDGYLAEAKQQMKSLSQKYSDYEHYPALKGYYTTTTALLEFCKEPTGSFELLKSTLNDYYNTARKYKNDVAFIFED